MRDKLVHFILLFAVIAYLAGIIALFILYPLVFVGCCVISVLIWVIGIRDSIVVHPDDPNF